MYYYSIKCNYVGEKRCLYGMCEDIDERMRIYENTYDDIQIIKITKVNKKNSKKIISYISNNYKKFIEKLGSY